MGKGLLEKLGLTKPLNLAELPGQTPEQMNQSVLDSIRGVVRDVDEPVRRRANTYIKEMDCDDRVLDCSEELFKRIHIHLKRRMLFVDDICHPLTASIGAHLADLHQADPDDIPNGHDCAFYFFKGSVEVLNLPCNIISPAGLTKSYTMAQYFEARRGICPIKSKFRGVITEAGFVGKENPGEDLNTYGDAHEYRNGFLLFNEISNIMIADKTTHSGNLINQVMEALSERHLSKRTGGAEFDYPTRLTIWGGIQPRRFEFSQGLGRRFIHITKAWTPEDVKQFKDEREKEKIGGIESKTVNMKEVEAIRRDISDLLHNANVEQVQWEGDMYRMVKKVAIGHLDLQMMERVLIGKEYLNQGLEKIIHIKNSEENKILVRKLVEMNQIVAEGGDLSLLLATIGAESISKDSLWMAFRRFGYQYMQFTELTDTAIKLGLVYKHFDNSKGGYFYSRSDSKRKSGPVTIVDKKKDARASIFSKLKKIRPITTLSQDDVDQF